MRKLVFVFLFFVGLQALAQNWERINVKGDELLGTTDKVIMVYNDNGNIFEFEENENNIFFLETSTSFFDVTSVKGSNGRYTVNGIVGLYDNNDNLVEKLEILFEILEPATKCYPNKYTRMGGNNLKRSKKVIDYINNGNGYVRFVLPLHLSTSNFDFTVPTLKLD